MDLESYLAFIGASIILCVVPGPDMVYLLSRTVVSGRRSGLYGAMGVNAGAYLHLFAAVVGLSALLMASSLAFTVVKWAGAAYLIYLGVTCLVAKNGRVDVHSAAPKTVSNRTVFWQGFLSDALNPKVALFYLAILPQFVDPPSAHPAIQLLVLGITLNMIGMITSIIYVSFASRVTRMLRESDRISYWLNKAMGSVFIALGLNLAREKQVT